MNKPPGSILNQISFMAGFATLSKPMSSLASKNKYINNNTLPGVLLPNPSPALITETIINFVEFIGIKVFKMPIDGNTFLPGLQLKDGALIVDTEKLLYPGDILHEAGHLATTPPEIRKTMSDNLPPTEENQGGEIMALAWSYAAARYLEIDPHIVFHPDGYKGGSKSLVENFSEGRYIGLPLLQWIGMAYDEHKAKEFNKQPFPHMINWLRQN